MTNGYTDKELLDYLQQILEVRRYIGRIRLKDISGGIELENVGVLPYKVGTASNIRQAIVNYIEERKRDERIL